MADVDDILAQYGEPSYTTADILARISAPRADYGHIPFGNTAIGLAALTLAPGVAARRALHQGINTSIDWLRSTQQMPGAKATDLFARPREGDNADIVENPNSVDKGAPLTPLGLASMGSPVSALGREALRAGAKGPSEGYSPISNRSLRYDDDLDRELAASLIPRATPESMKSNAERYGGPRHADAKVSMSPNRATEKGGFSYGIYKDGKLIGNALGSVSGNTAHINWIGGEGQANSIGVSGVRALREAIRADFPDVNLFEGNRSSGARKGPAARDDASTTQIVQLLSDAGKRSSLPGMIGNAVENASRSEKVSPATAEAGRVPGSLVFREEMQGNLAAVRKLYPEGGEFDPIVVASTKDGPLILDGHNRTVVAAERGVKIPAIEIPEAVYKKLLDAGFDETDISHAILARAGQEDAAGGIRQKFPGVRFDRSEDRINEILDQIEASAPNRGSLPPERRGDRSSGAANASDASGILKKYGMASPVAASILSQYLQDDQPPRASGGSVRQAETYGAGGTPTLDAAAIRNSYTDHDLGYGRQPIDPDYEDWRRRTIDERYAHDLGSVEVMQAMHALAGYRPGKRMSTNSADLRSASEGQLAMLNGLYDLIESRYGDGPSYAENYGPLPGPDLDGNEYLKRLYAADRDDAARAILEDAYGETGAR